MKKRTEMFSFQLYCKYYIEKYFTRDTVFRNCIYHKHFAYYCYSKVSTVPC